MMATNKGKIIALFALVFAFVGTLVFVNGIAVKVYAAEKTVRTVSSFLAEKEIDYSDVSINNRTLSVKLLSTGEDRCTLEDAKSIQAIYEAVHAQSIAGQVQNVGIEVYNSNGVLLYDALENDVSVTVENIDQLAGINTARNTEITANNIMVKVRNIVTEFPYSIEQLQITTPAEIAGKKVQLTLCENNNDIASIDDIRVIYDNLEEYAISTNAITQCEITVTNIDGDCVLYMAGDYLYGNCIAWISPSAESFFFAQEGPR